MTQIEPDDGARIAASYALRSVLSYLPADKVFCWRDGKPLTGRMLQEAFAAGDREVIDFVVIAMLGATIRSIQAHASRVER